MAATAKKAEAARNILQPSPVSLNRVPDWFRRALLRAFPSAKGASGSTSGSNVVDAVSRSLKLSWLDHWGSTKWRDRTAFVSEPYQLTLEDVQSVADLAKAIGCAYEIDANSFHYPGSTFRILILPRDAN